MNDRIKWHICQKHTEGSVCSGFLSTLRQTLSALLNGDMSKSQQLVNKFMDDNCYLEYDNTASHVTAKNKEKQELSNTVYYYPLNISDAKSTHKEIKNKLTTLLKTYKKMKKLLFMVLGVLMALPTLARDLTYKYEGQTLKYTVISEDDKTVKTKEGSESYPGNFVYRNLSIPSQVIDNKKVYTVTSIGNYAFFDCLDLTSVTIPNSITSIGYEAFGACISLTSVTIPNSVTSIGGYAFSGCSGLTSVAIPNSVTTIGFGAFSSCHVLTSVTIPNSVTSIGSSTFSSCFSLTSVTIPNSVTSIGDDAFFGCFNLTSVTIPNSVTSIGEYAFYGCSGLKKAEFASIESLCKIKFSSESANPLCYAQNLFVGGEMVTDVVIPNSVTSIGDYAFYGCSGLTSVTIGNSVTSIGDYAFCNCSELSSVYYNTKDPIKANERVFSTYNNATLYVPEAAVEKCKNTSPWYYFKNIQAFDFSGIEEIKAELDADAPYDIYNLNGVKVSDSIDTLAPGIYIVRQGDTVKKISVK